MGVAAQRLPLADPATTAKSRYARLLYRSR